MRSKLFVLLSVLGLVAGAVYLGNAVAGSPDIGVAVLVGGISAAVCIWLILQNSCDREFLLKLFIAALGVRWFFALVIFFKHKQSFFGGDAITYDAFGNALCRSWLGLVDPNAPWLLNYTSINRSGWGMFYYVAAVYYAIGQNPLALQLINASLGAAVAIVIYRISMLVWPRQRVARTAAVLTAFAPSMIIWSSQLLKDSPIVLFICLCALLTLKLRDELKIKNFVFLLISLFCLFSLRHYAAYIIFVAIAGTFLFAAKRFTPLRILQGGILVVIIGVSLVYFGAGQVAKQAFDLEKIQSGRVWSARVANSGFGGDVDITDPEAALTFLPVGVLYVMVAPFPWMMTNMRQLVTLPEMLIWWLLLPMMLKGYWFVLRNRLRESFVVCIFTISLILAYALYQSNVGTAYRHRAQLYGFFFILISIGLELRREARLKNRAQRVVRRPGMVLPVGQAAGSQLAGGSIEAAAR